MAHAASAFWGSGFDSALCLTYDGGMHNSPWFGGLYRCEREGGMTPLDQFSALHFAKITSLYTFINKDNDLNLNLGSGIYGSTFFMLTGFHGFHVTIGTIMLIVILGRCIYGHFNPKNHFAFEAVAWYWHFVDVVWLGLFIFVYWI